MYASRSFQPDPLMTVLTILLAYCVVRWSEDYSLEVGAADRAYWAGWQPWSRWWAAYFIGGIMLAAGAGQRWALCEGPAKA